MYKTLRIASLSAALSLAAITSASAQALATFGSAELAGFGEGSALLGGTLSTGHRGWGPIATAIVQTYRYRSGPGTHTQAYAFSPSVGLQDMMAEGSVQASVGYTFVSADAANSLGGIVAGNETGGKNGVFASAQGNYWGNGENTAQAIGSYNFASDYYWTRGRAAHRLAPSAHPVYVGAELVLQGSQDFTPSIFRFQAGPTIEYRVSPEFRVGASAGYRGGNNNAPGSGYARIEFLHLSRF
ncbi:MAG: hypothetical protein ABIY52_14525 [Gemmatimonadaceae bacterium]